jgi:diguanylate cyclase (GGDEF)-like protein
VKATISKKIGLILLLPALAAIALLWVFFSFLTAIETEVPFTDIAGRQRMLAEQLHKYAHMVQLGQQEDRKELRTLIDRFDTSLDILRHGGHLLGLDAKLPPPPDEIIPSLTTVIRLWSPLKEELLLIANLQENEPRAQQAWEIANAGMPELTVASSAVVKAIVAYDLQQHRQMGLLLAANMVFTLLLFIGGFLIARRFIVRPVQQLADVTVAMSGGEYSRRLRVRGHDELAGLMASFNTMADAITAAISRERKMRHQQEAISEAIIGLSRELAGETVLRHVGELAMHITGARYAMLSWLKDGEKQFIPLGVDDAVLADLKGHSPQGMGLLGLLWKECQLVRIENIASHPESYGFPKGHPPMTTMLGAPIEFAGNMVGALYLCDRKDGRPFDTEDENLVRMLASACAVALSNAQQFEHLQQANEGLEQRVIERTRKLNNANRLLRNHEIELELMNDELRNANEAKNQFLANTSHELRTPLNAIIGFSDLLLTTRLEKMPAKRKEYVDHINTSGKRLLTLINSLLDLSKIEAGMLDIHEEPSTPGVVLDFTISQLRPLAEKKKIEMHVVRPEEDCALYIDTGKLQQVWINLIGNAIKFTPEGGRIEAGFNISNDGGQTILEGYVQDSGIGLKPADIERIFRPFVQAEGGLTREFGGTGLGLALVRRLLEMQGGAIHLESTPGAGSRFMFTLPVQLVTSRDETMAPVAAEAGLAAVEATSTNAVEVIEEEMDETRGMPLILIVDDDKARAAAVTGLLQDEGYLGVICDLSQVERMVEETFPFLVMVGMPEDPVDIYRRLHLLRSRKATRNIPLVLLGGHAETPHFSLGTVDTVDKQMTRNDLVDLISRHGRHTPQIDIMTILVVDDETSVREYIKESLHGQGYRILLAANGRDGLQAAIEHEPDLIILDLMMPGMSGFEVVEELKRHPTACDIPVVIFTAKDLTREEVMRLGQEVEKVLAKGMTGRADLLRELRSLELLYPVQARLIDSTLRCYNPRYKLLRLAQEYSRAERYGQQFSLVGWEMDGFNDYVREHGRRWGMAALKDCVDLVHAAIRKGDVLTRSDEAAFTLILPGITPFEAERVAEKIRLRIRLHRFSLPGSEAAGHFTASFGCSHFNEGGTCPDAMVAKMRARITRARKAGGNCCVCSDEEEA